MPHWLIKSAIHRGISVLPRRQFWNGLFQRCVTRSTGCNPRQFEEKLAECERHRKAIQAARATPEFTLLDLGTGWHPVIPLGLYLCGANEIWSFDIEPLLVPAGLKDVLDYFSNCGRRGDLARLLPGFRAERLAQLEALRTEALRQSPAALLERINFHLLVRDAQKTGLPDWSVDFFVSSGVLQYIPRPVLEGIMAEFRRVARPGAVMSHRINLEDQFYCFDRSITPFNFLRYTAPQWRWLDSPLISQSRLRISDYREIIAGAGFDILSEENTSGAPEALAKVKLAPEFRRYSQAELLVLHSWISARTANA